MNKIMLPGELRDHIRSFLKDRKDGSLATCNEGIARTSPVQYFLGQDLDIYILSAGGEKFRNLKKNSGVCLLVCTDYLNYTRVKGVQIFGEAKTDEDDKDILKEAGQFCPDCHTLQYILDSVKVIKIIPKEIVYLNSLDEGDRTKHILKGDHITVRTDKTPSPMNKDKILTPTL
ncbi:MAG TPA: pyridoxamine 5'-phosphate oxidase family protein [Bacillota bacterium]|nr:pyridoxamine 5'-phosphate oxidase family protein [Bacillota bacterium]